MAKERLASSKVTFANISYRLASLAGIMIQSRANPGSGTASAALFRPKPLSDTRAYLRIDRIA